MLPAIRKTPLQHFTYVNDTASRACDALGAAREQWKKIVVAELNGAPFEKKLVTRTFEGVPLQPLYTRADNGNVRGLGQRPGDAPYLRGTHARGYKDGRWQVAQEIAERTPAEFNAALLAGLAGGQDCVVLRPDRATRVGFDEADGESRAGGLPISSLANLARALAGVDLRAVPVHVTAGQDALPLAALYLALTRDRGIAWGHLTGSITADPLGEWAGTGRITAQLDTLYDALAGWTAWAANHAPQLQTIGVNAGLWGNAGATAVQELAFALAAASEYLRALDKRGVGAVVAGERLEFRFAVGPQFFTEVAKLRAWRPLWTRLLVAFGAPPGAAAHARVHAATGRWNKTLLDPHVNMLRVTTEALSAVLGGCDALHIAPFDEPIGKTDDFSRRIARNVHTLLAEEFNFDQVADAAGGSWYVEKLTDELARKAWTLFQEIEAQGGFAAALRNGYPQQLAHKAAAEKADAVATRRLALIGTNLFPNLKAEALRRDDEPRRTRVGASAAPEVPGISTESGWPIRFEAALAAAKRGATVAQLARLTRPLASSEWIIVPAAPWRAAAPFEALRAAAGAFSARTGARPRVFLAKMGPVAQHKARADFAAGFFATGGCEVLAKQRFESAEAAAEAAAASGATVVVLCSTDETYPALVPTFAAAVKAKQAGLTVVLAGLPGDPAVIEAYRKAGVDEFIHVRARVDDVLEKLFKQMGALT